jgi:hypothetical protein
VPTLRTPAARSLARVFALTPSAAQAAGVVCVKRVVIGQTTKVVCRAVPYGPFQDQYDCTRCASNGQTARRSTAPATLAMRLG